MQGATLTAGDLALLRNNEDGMFGGSGSWVFFLFFLLDFSCNKILTIWFLPYCEITTKGK